MMARPPPAPAATHPPMPDPDAVRWIACISSGREADAFWQGLGAMRRLGIQVSLCWIEQGEAPPWPTLLQLEPRQGLMLWPQQPKARIWASTAQSLGLAVRWWPQALQACEGAWPSGQSRM